MAGEQEAIAPGTEAAPPPIATEVEEPQKVEDSLPDPLSAEAVEAEFADELADAEAEAEELEEFEWNGKPIKAPKGLKDGVMMQADYTKKTQEVAERRRELDATAKRVQEQAQHLAADLEQRAEYISTRKQIEAYKNVDWQAWSQTDSGAAQAAFIQYQTLQTDLQRMGSEIQERASKRTAEAQQERQTALAKRLQETQDYARREIPGWKPERDKQLVDFATSQGINVDDLRDAMNPTIYKILHLAEIGFKASSKPAAIPKLKQAVPLKTVAAKANPPARVDLGNADMDSYVSIRKKQGFGAGRAR